MLFKLLKPVNITYKINNVQQKDPNEPIFIKILKSFFKLTGTNMQYIKTDIHAGENLLKF